MAWFAEHRHLKLFLTGLLLWLFFSELIYWAMHRDGMAFSMVGYRVQHLVQMALLIGFAFWCWRRIRTTQVIPVAERVLWGRVSTAILVALILSFCGDLINSYLFDLESIIKPQTLLSVVPFLLAHLLYIRSFWRLSHESERGRSMVWRLLRNPMLLLWPLLAGVLWQAVVSPEAGGLIKGVSAVYAIIVVLMAITSLWVLLCRGLVFWPVALGGGLFLASDTLLGLHLLAGPDRPFIVSQLIWLSYFLAQFLIATVLLRSSMLNQTGVTDVSQASNVGDKVSEL